MLLVQRNDMVEKFPTTTSDPSFRDTILPGRLHACPFGFQPTPASDGVSRWNAEPAAPVLCHEKAIERLKRDRWHREKIQGDDYLAMILEETQPSLTWTGATSVAP
jgi:hypothetical protein